jgi:hypothetical protein
MVPQAIVAIRLPAGNTRSRADARVSRAMTNIAGNRYRKVNEAGIYP